MTLSGATTICFGEHFGDNGDIEMMIMAIYEQSFIAGYTEMTLSSITVCFGDNFGNNSDNIGDDNGHIQYL